ncbi:MAG TPA: translation initiation factor IF-2, partial [Oceanospirillaceae bacterium]|nr:translation initiation factor IF-2 [Oceanospirillaceae bacterium]
MADLTVEKLALTVGVPVERLLTQMEEAGLAKRAAKDAVSEEERKSLLVHLQKAHGGSGEEADGPKKITLRRKTTSTLKVAGSGGKRTVNVEVRKKRTYVKQSEEELQAKLEAEQEQLQEQQAVAEREAADQIEQERAAAEKAAAEKAAAEKAAAEK